MNQIEVFFVRLVFGICLALHLALQSVKQHLLSMSTSHRQHSLPVQLMLAAVGLVIMAITGAWLLPGIPLVVLIKLLHDHPVPLTWLQSTRMYAQVSKVANTISHYLLVDPRNKELLWVSLACVAGTTFFTVNLILEQLAHPNSFPWTAFLLRQAFMAGTLSQAFAAKHRESHNRTATYKHPLVQALLGRVSEWWTGAWYGNIPETDRCGHGFVHHRNDLDADDWGTAHLDRTSIFSFLQFVVTAGVYHNCGLGPQLQFAAAKVYRLNRQMGIGMAAYYGAAALTWALGGWRLFVLLWAWPLVANCGYVSVINWCWHAFADPQDPDNFLGSTITVTNWPGDIFAEGFHVPHHLRAAEHYTLCRSHWDTHRVSYAAHNCVVLHGSDPLALWANLLASNWGYFAARFEDFSGQMTLEQKKAFCRYRTRALGSKPGSEVEASAVALAAQAQRAAQKHVEAEEAARRQATAVSSATIVKGTKGAAQAAKPIVKVKAG